MTTLEEFSSDENLKSINNKMTLILNRIGRIDSKHHSKISEINRKIKSNEIITSTDADFISRMYQRL